MMSMKTITIIPQILQHSDSYYKSKNLDFLVKALPSSFVVRLPRITIDKISIKDDYKIIIDYLDKNGEITRKQAERLLNKEKTTASNVLSKMISDKIIKKIGKGPNTKYIKI